VKKISKFYIQIGSTVCLKGEEIQIPIDEEGDFRIAKKMAIVGLWCI